MGRGVLGFHLQAQTAKAGQRATARAEGRLDERSLSADLSGEAIGLVPKLNSLAVEACRVRLSWHHAWPDQGQAALSCRVKAEPEPLPKQDEIPLDWPRSLTMQIAADAKTPLPLGGSEPVSGQLKAVLLPLHTRELSLTSATEVAVAGDLSELPGSLHLLTTSRTELSLPDFAKVVRSLGKSRFAVPAPLNVLTGSLTAQVNASGDLTHGGLDLPLTLLTRMHSGEKGQADAQRLDTDVAGTLHFDPFATGQKATLDVKAQLTDVQLALPRITLADSTPPQLLPDARMQSTQKIKAAAAVAVTEPVVHPDLLVGPPPPPEASAFSYSVQIASPDTQPLHLLSNLAKEPVPIQVNLQAASGSAASGHVGVREFPLNLFRRKAYVDKFDIALAGPGASPTVDGKLRVEYTDYTITILLLGTLKTPEVKLTSEPPRPQNQLIAVLLFGKEMNELDDDQLKSVDNFGGAAADGALSLASMYLLASTPVQSVGYNPQTSAFTAKINVGKGTSINIGSDLADYQKLGVQKRLAREWAVETYVERTVDTETEAVTALLEWSRRF